MRRGPHVLLVALLAWTTAAPVALLGPAQAGHDGSDCKAHPPGGHDPRARVEFSASLRGQAEVERGKSFDYGRVRHLFIEVRWERFKLAGRQRLELYAPDGQLYQTFTSDLPRRPDLVVLTVPVAGTPIFLNTLAGKWCARVFLDDDLEPVAAEDVELRFTPGQ
jgi:hypothetical protein